MYQDILESLMDIIFLIDEEGRVVYANQKELSLNFKKIGDNIYENQGKVYCLDERFVTIEGKNYKVFQYKESTALYQIILNQRKDSTTGLANRLVVDQYLQALEKKAKNGVIAMVDIDYFKSINDTYGHPFGDQILAQLASLLRSNIGPNDFVGRYGGEEFVIVLDSKNLRSGLIQLNEVRKAVEENLRSSNYNITVSIGAVEFTNENSIMTKLKEADLALYYVKENGRNNVGFLNNYDNQYMILSAPKQTNSIRRR